MVRIQFFNKDASDHTDYNRYIIMNTLQNYEGDVTLNHVPESKTSSEDAGKYGIGQEPVVIVSGEDKSNYTKLEGIIRKKDLMEAMSKYA